MPLITFEGLDGSGKSTVIKSVARSMKNPLVLAEPGGTSLGEKIRDILKGEASSFRPDDLDFCQSDFFQFLKTTNLRDWAESVELGQTDLPYLDPVSEVLLFNLSRSHLVLTEIKPALSRGNFVLLDRFFDSTIAYQGYGHGLDLDWVSDISKRGAEGLEPDMTFYLKIDPETRHSRMKNRPSQDRIEKNSEEFFTRVSAGFDALSSEERFCVIDAEAGKNQVLSQVLRALEWKYF